MLLSLLNHREIFLYKDGLIPYVTNHQGVLFHYLILYRNYGYGDSHAAKRKSSRKFIWLFNHYLRVFSKNWDEASEKANVAVAALW
jgi:hypothetical protein